MITLELNLQQLKNEITHVLVELQELQNKSDNERRDGILRLTEKLRHLRSQLETTAPILNVK